MRFPRRLNDAAQGIGLRLAGVLIVSLLAAAMLSLLVLDPAFAAAYRWLQELALERPLTTAEATPPEWSRKTVAILAWGSAVLQGAAAAALLAVFALCRHRSGAQ